ncbi:protein-tyrosine phosphatase domain-containing protein [Ditylenchus destructor]|uniref:Protein-tyrosine phosphatase domain-containing protein n=1 Tax=Ditylenchus destructor TaxID=166010 RepID=A0AAD4NM28_9BILA|nr:protein-tyrosine phosphatase domain-containing protein [Ditylenchus destructor]
MNLFISILIVCALTPATHSALLQGCNFGEELCDPGEVCVPDGLFGQCYNDVESELIKPLILEQPLDDFQNELLRAELTRLANNGFDWPHARSQCVLAYFKLSIVYQLDYDTEFCSVRNPNNIWSLVQRVQNILASEQEAASESIRKAFEDSTGMMLPEGVQLVEEVDANALPDEAVTEDGETVVVPVVIMDDPSQIEDGQPQMIAEDQQPVSVLVAPVEDPTENATAEEQPAALTEAGMNSDKDEVLRQLLTQMSQNTNRESEKRSSRASRLTDQEDKQLDEYVRDVLNDRNPNLKALSSKQLDKLVTLVGSLQNALKETEVRSDDESDPEMEEIIPLASENDQQQLLLLKKDAEKFNNVDMGLANTVHKIVKGGVQRVEGNRVYLKVEKKDNVTEEELYKLIAYLDRKIAEPNDLYFDEFLYEDGQLSFRISRPDIYHQKKTDKELENASGVAQAVYKRRKDIQTLAGVEVDETGIGSGLDVVPVEKAGRDWLFVPILAVCALTITSLVSVLAVHLYKNRRHSYKSNLPEVIDSIEGKQCAVYEDLCRQRMNEAPIAVSVARVGSTKHSRDSTSSWPDESLLQTTNLDISTGHVILSFLQDCLKKPSEISDQWSSLENYGVSNAQTTVASDVNNADKNFDDNVLPYDESIVVLRNTQQSPSKASSSIVDVESGTNYINASKIYDSDPRQIAYIATQSPMQNTVNDFWQMVWEQGIALIVNLCDQEDQQNPKCAKYWPEEGSKVSGSFEIYMVSEHIWSEDYVVRSLYLKNLSTNETRTVTQFHFLTWPNGRSPRSIKSLLEFRRKVNKSYRGHSSPVLVHCTNGAGRSGTYMLIDVAINRILKGVKEINIAGSLEHLRDQRIGLVDNEEQYKFAFSAVAEEVSSLLKNLQH